MYIYIIYIYIIYIYMLAYQIFILTYVFRLLWPT